MKKSTPKILIYTHNLSIKAYYVVFVTGSGSVGVTVLSVETTTTDAVYPVTVPILLKSKPPPLTPSDNF